MAVYFFFLIKLFIYRNKASLRAVQYEMSAISHKRQTVYYTFFYSPNLLVKTVLGDTFIWNYVVWMLNLPY